MNPVWTIALSLLAPLATQGLEIRGTTSCPSPTDVLDRMGSLLSVDSAVPPTDWLELRDVPSQAPDKPDLEMRLSQTGADGPLGIRRLQRNQSCSETADAVAVIAASWIGNYATSAPALPPLPAAPRAAPPKPGKLALVDPNATFRDKALAAPNHQQGARRDRRAGSLPCRRTVPEV